MFFPVSEWFPAFVLTLAVEIPIVIALLRSAEPRLPRLVALVVYVNLATHLAVWYVFTQLFELGSAGYTVAAEGWAIAAEAIFYRLVLPGVTWRRVAVVALVANGASFVVGRLVGRAWLGFVA